MEKEVKRGDVWWISLDDSVGYEMQTGRPALVVSADGINEKISTVVVAYLTTSDLTSSPSKVKFYLNGRTSAVICNQLRTVDKSRLTTYVASLSEDDMRRVMGALALTLCIPYGKTTPVPAPVSTPAPAKNNSDVVALQVELDLLRKQYDIVLEKLVEKRVSEDIAKRTAPSKVPEKVVEVAPPVVEPAPNRFEINSCTLEELRSIGCSQIVATSIMEHRPYKSVEDLRTVPWVTSVGFQILKNKIYCVPVIPPKFKMTPAPNKVVEKPAVKATGKVNINTCTVNELTEAGINITTARQIISVRKLNGPYKKIEDLLNVPRIGRVAFPKYAAKLEV